MKKIPVWIDCDVGVDDAVALLVANKLDELQIVGISTVCGNVELEKTYPNAHRLNRLMGSDYPIYAGADKPWFKKLHIAPYVHGDNGLGDVELPLPETMTHHEEKAWDAIYEAAKQYPGELQLIAIGPLTNVATALAKYSDLSHLLGRILIMGGSASFGNCTPCAEFNIYVDPHAAEAVFQSGIPIVMCGLDVTMKAYFQSDELKALNENGNAVGRFVYESTKRAVAFASSFGFEMFANHDSCPILYLVYPDMFKGEQAGVYVETKGKITEGKTVTDLYSDKQFDKQNVFVVLDVDRERFVQVIAEKLAQY